MSGISEGKDFDLTCWYLNLRRVAELTGGRPSETKELASISDVDEQTRKLWLLAYFKNRITEWIGGANPPSLDELILKNKLKENTIFTHFSTYYFKGLSKTRQALTKGSAQIPMAEAYSKLDDLREGLRVRFSFSHEHLTSNSSWSELSGQKKVLIIGLTKNVTASSVEIVPYVVA